MLKWFRVKDWTPEINTKKCCFLKNSEYGLWFEFFPFVRMCSQRLYTAITISRLHSRKICIEYTDLPPSKDPDIPGTSFFSFLRFGKFKYYEKVHKSCSEAIFTTVMWPVSFQLGGPIILFWFFTG